MDLWVAEKHKSFESSCLLVPKECHGADLFLTAFVNVFFFHDVSHSLGASFQHFPPLILKLQFGTSHLDASMIIRYIWISCGSCEQWNTIRGIHSFVAAGTVRLYILRRCNCA